MRDIVLTEQELEDLTDTIKFREKVIHQLKQLNGIPNKVRKLEVWGVVYWFFIGSVIVVAIVKVFNG